MFLDKNNQGQSLMEYTIILSLVVAALSMMQVYLKRGIQATIKVAADEVGSQEYAQETDPEKGLKADSEITTKTISSKRIRLFEGGSQTIEPNETTTSSGWTEYNSWDEEK